MNIVALAQEWDAYPERHHRIFLKLARRVIDFNDLCSVARLVVAAPNENNVKLLAAQLVRIGEAADESEPR